LFLKRRETQYSISLQPLSPSPPPPPLLQPGFLWPPYDGVRASIPSSLFNASASCRVLPVRLPLVIAASLTWWTSRPFRLRLGARFLDGSCGKVGTDCRSFFLSPFFLPFSKPALSFRVMRRQGVLPIYSSLSSSVGEARIPLPRTLTCRRVSLWRPGRSRLPQISACHQPPRIFGGGLFFPWCGTEGRRAMTPREVVDSVSLQSLLSPSPFSFC